MLQLLNQSFLEPELSEIISNLMSAKIHNKLTENITTITNFTHFKIQLYD